MKPERLKENKPAKTIEEGDWEHAKAEAKKVKEWWNENNGDFEQTYSHGYAIHHAQVSEDPFNFFVVDEAFTNPDFSDSEKNESNFYFKKQVIYNPEIVTALKTRLEDNEEGEGKKAVSNIYKTDEACMSYPNREPKKAFERFDQITVRYNYISMFGNVKEKEETIEGLKSQIFQHEIWHGRGWSIYHGDGEEKYIDIERRLREDGKTMEEVQQELEDKENDFVERIKEKNDYGIAEHMKSGEVVKVPLDRAIPKDYVQGSLERYYNNNGTLKEEYQEGVEIIEGVDPDKLDDNEETETDTDNQ